MAVLSLLLTAPGNITIHLYIDSQNTINGLLDLYKTDAVTLAKSTKRPNYLLWLVIGTIIQQKNITINSTKVQAHADDTSYQYKEGNDRADAAAKEGLFSSSTLNWSIYMPTTLYAHAKFDHLPIDISIRSFIKDYFQASYYNRLFQLRRFDIIFQLTEADAPDWSVTWANLEYQGESFKHTTSFTKHNKVAFTAKLLADELPVLNILQVRDHSSYTSFIRCLICNQAMETIDHVWTCTGLLTHQDSMDLTDIITKVQHTLLKKAQNTNIHGDILSHAIWTKTHSTNHITLGWFIRGFVPISFVKILQDALTLPDPVAKKASWEQAEALATETLHHFQTLLYKHKWVPRCKLFNEAEEQLGITIKKKKNPNLNRSFQRGPSSSPTSLQNFHHSWLTNGITKGNTWKDFYSGVNSIFHLDFSLVATAA